MNHSKTVNDDELSAFVNALGVQLQRDVTPVWGRYVVPWVARADAKLISADSWRLNVWDDPPAYEGLMGRHGTDGKDYVPTGHVYVNLCRLNKFPWTAVASHEALEMLGNEGLNLDVARWRADGVMELWPRELCDAVQGVLYDVNGVKVSDFVLPEYFHEGSDGPFDFCRALKKAFEIHPSGYSSVLEVKDGMAKRKNLFGAACPDWNKNLAGSRRNAHWRHIT